MAAGANPGPDGPASGRRAQIVGTGLIGGSVGLALRADGWWVTGSDRDGSLAALALECGAIDAVGVDPTAEICFVALPVSSIAAVSAELLELADWVVTDVGSVKGPVTSALRHPRFVGGHPMAGSEQDGVRGSIATMFDGAVWVLTPSEVTDPEALALVHSIVTSFGADVVTIDAATHDSMVAMVSHVPHLTAASLMAMAAERAASGDQGPVLRLAAGGFRDMTRIAAGHPGIWPDICAENRDAIVSVLDAFIGELAEVREAVSTNDRDRLLARLERAREARVNLPTTAVRPEELVELRVGVPDRRGVLAAVTTLATAHDVNIYDIEIAHSAEGPRGVLILLVDATAVDAFTSALAVEGYTATVRSIA